MRSRLKRVIQRLCYEGYMHSTEFAAAKTHFTLRDILESGEMEPRLYEVLPALVRFDPGVIRNLKRDLLLNPKVARALGAIDRVKGGGNFFGVPYEDCIKQMRIIAKIVEQKSSVQKTRNLNIRVSEHDLVRLTELSRLYKKSKSDVIRELIASSSL